MKRRGLGVWLVAMALGWLAAPAPAAAEETGYVRSKNLAVSTVDVDGTVYQVTSATLIQDLDGRTITLAQVPVASDPPNSMGQEEPGAVSYEATAGSSPQLVRLQLIEAEPK